MVSVLSLSLKHISLHNFGQRKVEKFIKLSKIHLSMEYYANKFLQCFRKLSQTLSLK